MTASVLAFGCGGDGPSSPTEAPLVVRAGAWSYALTANNIPLMFNPPGPPGCISQTVSGSTNVDANGAFSIPFSGLTCNSCTMGGTITGTVVPSSVTGSITASTSGAGCSSQQSTHSASMSGSCTASGCTVTVNATPQASLGMSYTLTPP